jgi:hypothetical protein
MPEGKPAFVPCVQLTEDFKCKLFGKPERPKVCSGFMAEPDFCGDSPEEAAKIFRWLLDAEENAPNKGISCI